MFLVKDLDVIAFCSHGEGKGSRFKHVCGTLLRIDVVMSPRDKKVGKEALWVTGVSLVLLCFINIIHDLLDKYMFFERRMDKGMISGF